MSTAAQKPSGPSASPSLGSGATLGSPSNVPQQLQSHLYEAFLSGETSDISVRVSGSWDAVYRLHRLVLTQAGFFRSLFTSGFMEASRNGSTMQGQVVVGFDQDPNITRPAFEYILARLYGGGPPLFVCPTLQPTTTEPLTAAYMRPRLEKPATPKGYQPTTPRFLLSLLSTAFYLSVPSVASEILQLILSSIGPTTVVRYLDYAIGRGIGQPTATEPERVITLESIGEDVDFESVFTAETDAIYDPSLNTQEKNYEDTETTEDKPAYLYGVIGNKIGEACASFLTRWGVDLLDQEEQHIFNSSVTQFAAPTPIYPNQHSTPTSAHSSSTSTWRSSAPSPRIWSHGLTADWIRGIISSDEFFVRNELTRFEVATRVVEMRRRLRGVDPEDEKEWVRLFEEGIYYSHFAWDDVFRISEERSLVTGKPFVSLSHLQKSYWSFSTMRHLIVNQRNSSLGQLDPISSNTDAGGKGLGLGLSILEKDISSPSIAEDSANSPIYWPIPSDTSLRIGDPGIVAATEGLFDHPPRAQPGRRPISARNFFGIGNPRQTAEQILSRTRDNHAPETGRMQKWISNEPFRFSVEFWGIESLKEKTRLYSHTIWYAGSCYNVYIQAVRKKGLQLGVYLQRQSNVDPIPLASAPRTSSRPATSWSSSSPNSPLSHAASRSTSALTASRPHARSIPTADSPSRNQTPGPATRPATANMPLQSTTPVTIPRSPQYIHLNSSFSPASPAPGSPLNSPPSQSSMARVQSAIISAPPDQPYRDPRTAVSAYFSISCHSTTGSSLTRFCSAPDTFAVSQSWGWKSSSLDVGTSNEEQESEELSLRATIVIGLV